MALIFWSQERYPDAEFYGDVRRFKKSPKAPAAPDPVATAQAQTATNKETALWNAALNNVNQVNPYGSLTYTQQSQGDGLPPQYTATTTLSPEQQQVLNYQNQSDIGLAKLGNEQLGRISDSVSSPFSFSGIPDAFTEMDTQAASQRGEQALLSRLNPQFSQNEEALRTRLINQGIGQGSEAYRREFDQFNQSKNDAQMQAILQGANYGGTLQSQALQRRNQGINEYTTQRNAPLNEYSGLTSGTQIQNPSFQNINYEGTNPVDYAGLVNNQYQAQLGAYNSKVASNNSTMGSLFSLGGSALGSAGGSAGWLAALSDPALKENIILVGNKNGHNIYEYDYKNGSGRYRGVMADEVKKLTPNAVVIHNGYMAVNYGMIGIEMERVHA